MKNIIPKLIEFNIWEKGEFQRFDHCTRHSGWKINNKI